VRTLIEPAFDFDAPGFQADPYPTFRAMRETAPVYLHRPLGIWMLTRHDHCAAAVRDRTLSNVRARPLLAALMPSMRGTPALEALADQWSKMLWFQDPPRHTATRRMVNRAFGPQNIEALRLGLRAVVDRCVAQARDRVEIELVGDLAEAVAITTISEMFQVPEPDRGAFKAWTVEIMKIAGAGATTEDASRRSEDASKRLFAYIGDLAAERARQPGEDALSRFLGGPTQDPDVIADVAVQGVQMLGASYLTSRNQIGNLVLALLQHPDALAALRADPGLTGPAIEEILRFVPASLVTSRLTTDSVRFGDVTIPSGALVFPVVAAANRDPEVFPRPDVLDLRRAGPSHLTFSLGPHYCPGGGLVRLELEEVLRGLLTLPCWALAGPVDWGAPNLQDRGPKSMRVSFAPTG
jgi:cytochrome P450